MIDISNYKEILINDVKRADIEIEVGKKNGTSFRLNLDATDFIEGGSLSTGNLISDVVIYITIKLKDISNSLNTQQIPSADIVGLYSHELVSKYNEYFEIGKVYVSNNFEKLPGVDSRLFLLAMLNDESNSMRAIVDDTLKAGERYTASQKEKVFNIGDMVLLLFKTFMYYQSQSYRNKLTANACYKIVNNNFGNFHNNLAYSDIYIFDKFINDYVSIKGQDFLAKHIYPLSRNNNSRSSNSIEVLSKIDSYNNLSDLRKDTKSDMTVITTMPRILAVSNYSSGLRNIGILNCYKKVEDDCMISTSIYCKYNEGSDVEQLNLYLTKIFYKVYFSNCDFLKELYSQYKNYECFKYENLIFDKSIDEILSNKFLDFHMTYTSYTHGGGARLSDSTQLQTKKITPTKRRDMLYEAILDLTDTCKIDIKKLFSRLDVDFKRFYGHKN